MLFVDKDIFWGIFSLDILTVDINKTDNYSRHQKVLCKLLRKRSFNLRKILRTPFFSIESRDFHIPLNIGCRSAQVFAEDV